jgi:uncharacterized membrane protein
MQSGLWTVDRLRCRALTQQMSSSPFLVLTSAAAVGAAAVGGLFFAFSTFVMHGLDRTDATDAIVAMRGINTEAQANAPFLVMFFGTMLLALGVGIVAVLHLRQPGSGYLLAGAVLTIVAAVVTVAFNVPLNNQLAGLNPDGLSPVEAAAQWQAYRGPWTAWNHVRTVAPLAGSVLLVIGLRYR